MVEIIKKLCKTKGTNLKKLEETLEFGNGTIRNWDKKEPAAYKLYKVAEYFGVSMEYIITGKEKTYNQEEITLIQLYRAADQRGKERIMQDAITEGTIKGEEGLSESKIS